MPVNPGDLLRTRCDRPPPIVEWDDDAERFEGHGVTETLPPGDPVLFLRRGRRSPRPVGGWSFSLPEGWDDDLEPLGPTGAAP